jgi:hypothetical protein
VVFVSRVVLTVTPMTEKDAEKAMGERYDDALRERCIRIDRGKNNVAAPGMHTLWVRKDSVEVGNATNLAQDNGDQIAGLSREDFAEFQISKMERDQTQKDRLLTVMAEVMQDIGAGSEIKLRSLLTRIMMKTTEFGKERTLRDMLDMWIPIASMGGVRVGEHLYHRRQQGEYDRATIYVCKSDVP